MKLLLVGLLTTLTFNAFAGGIKSIEGEYAAKKTIVVWSTSEDECLADKGSWNSEDDVCELPTQDNVEVKKMGRNYELLVSTIGNNYHMCEYKQSAKLVAPNKLISRVKAEEYNYETDSIGKVECVVTAVVDAKGAMVVSNNGHCQSFCGVNSWLEAAPLIKVKK